MMDVTSILQCVERLHEVSVSRADAGYHQSTIDHASKERGILVSLFSYTTVLPVYMYHCLYYFSLL